MKHNPNATANAAAVTVGIIYVVCRLLVGLFPDLMMSIAQSWFHGITIGTWSISTGNFIVGLISAVASAWVAGYLFAASYNSFLKRLT
jgi:hypothetical protein